MRLVIEDSSGTRSVVPLASDEITLGRAREGNTFRLDDRDVSRHHARLVRASGALFIEDLGSLNGTRLNGERINGRRRLREGDLIEIGEYDLALLPEADGPGAPPALRPTPAPGSAAGAPAGSPRPAGPAAGAAAGAGVAPLPAGEAGPGPPAQVGPPPATAPAPSAPAPVAAVAVTTAVPAPLAPAPAPAASVGGSPPAPAPAAPRARSPVGRALRVGAVALAIGFAAGWAVGTLTAPGQRPAGEAPAPR